QLMFTDISLIVWDRFKQIFDQIKTNNNFSLEEMYPSVAMDIRSLGENIKKKIVQGLYERNIKKKNGFLNECKMEPIKRKEGAEILLRAYREHKTNAGAQVTHSVKRPFTELALEH
ncbi:17237_t:CDS:2, partial [Acaulospora colombiana]